MTVNAASSQDLACPETPDLVARLRCDPAMVRDYGRPNAVRLTETELAVALGYQGASGRQAVARLRRGQTQSPGLRLLVMALLDGWRPRG